MMNMRLSSVVVFCKKVRFPVSVNILIITSCFTVPKRKSKFKANFIIIVQTNARFKKLKTHFVSFLLIVSLQLI